LWLPVLAAGNLASAEPALYVNSTFGVPGSTVQVAVGYMTDTNAPSLQFDLLFSTNYLSAGTPTLGNAAPNHQIGSAEVDPGVTLVLIYSLENTPLTNGVLAYVPLTIASNAPDHDESLMLSNIVVSSMLGTELAATSSNGVLSIVVPPQFTSVTFTNGGVQILLAGTTGRRYRLEATTSLSPPLWTALATNLTANGVAVFNDVGPPAYATRFYRASFVPP
jgi:hypothetical protein